MNSDAIASKRRTVQQDMFAYEQSLWDSGIRYIAGIDEVGRGPLAGPVVAAAVIFEAGVRIEGVNDSKQLTEKKRESLFPLIYEHAASVGIGVVDHLEIDKINILKATYRAMHLAVEQLGVRPEHLLVDGPRFEVVGIPFTAIVRGDARCFSIAAASIIAKVTRDRFMMEFDARYPQYGFKKHKGYGTKAHLESIKKFGRCPIHRKSFRMPE
jgi:ribonuclease HII